MRVFHTMALGGGQKESLLKNLCTMSFNDVESNSASTDDDIKKNETLSFAFLKKHDEFFSLNKKNSDGAFCSKVCDRKLNEFVDCNAFERNDDINQSSDSLSSSASISDSDLTSTDSDDSLALSESESITDVTPLNSPYCDSPLPQSRHIEHKSDDKSIQNPCRNVEYDASGDSGHRPEMNVLMKAIEKLEIEAKSSDVGFHESLLRRRAASSSNEEAKRIEQENQCLFKRVISQQNRIRSIYSSPNQPCSKNISCRHQDLVKSDGDISGTPKKFVVGKDLKEGDKPQAHHRKQKCLSHPSSLMYSCNHAMDKSLLTDGLSSESRGKKKYVTSGNKIACPQKTKNSCEEAVENPVEKQ